MCRAPPVRDGAQRVGAGTEAFGINIPQALDEIRHDEPGQMTTALLEVIEETMARSGQALTA